MTWLAFVAHHSSGAVTDSHRLPFYPDKAPGTQKDISKNSFNIADLLIEVKDFLGGGLEIGVNPHKIDIDILCGKIRPAVCLMPNHYHLEIETHLGMAMQWLKRAYTVYFNRRHRRSGHLFQGCYKATLVEEENHLVELTRYIHLNPVRAALVVRPEDYAWSSYRQYIGARRRWKWLETAWTLEQFGGAGREGRRGIGDLWRRASRLS